MREFDRPLHFGNDDQSIQTCNRLLARIVEAFNQQAKQGSNPDKEDLVHDFAMALLGKTVRIGNEGER